MDQVTIIPVKLISLPPAANGELADHVYQVCDFCGKNFELSPAVRKHVEQLSGHKSLYCPFCLRHGYNTKNNRNVLIMTFRSIIGYYYHEFYLVPHTKMWLAEIKDYIDIHARVGLISPLFTYDPETLLWFVDFSKVGLSKKKLKVEEVLKMTINILACFNLSQQIPQMRMTRFYNKYKEAIMQFHTKRYRPEGKPVLAPTLTGCVNTGSKLLERTRVFIANDLEEKH